VELLDQFVCVRVVSMNDVDLSVFRFDYDVTWMGFFMDSSDGVYSRYGGRDAGDPDGRLSIDGLKRTMRQVLELHQRQAKPKTTRPHNEVLPSDLFEVKGKCLHCHQVWEGLRKQARKEKRFDPESLFVYPPPENIGLTLDVTKGNEVVAVAAGSSAERAGIRAGDVIQSIQNVKTLSQGDVMWALHNAPVEGTVTLRFVRGEQTKSATLKLPRGWKLTDLSWRPSMKKEKNK
jgi:predicted metalloprotease with PDZ domain